MTVTALLLGMITGFALASIYVLIALSLTLVLAASGVFNFAQGTIVMIGSILALIFGVRLGWPPLLAMAGITVVGVVAGFLVHVIAVWPAIGRSRSFSHTTVLTTIGLATAANAIIALLFGGDSHAVPSYVSDQPIMLFSIPLRPTYLVMVSVGAAVTIAIEIVLRRTQIGHVLRVTLEDAEGAQLLGIDTRKVIISVFGLAGGLSALAGYLIAPVTAASAFVAQDLAFYGFAGMAIGGFGSFGGALIGGVIVGLLAGIMPIVVDPQAAVPVIWGAVIAVLLVKPAGLFGTAGLFGATRSREV
jgi:branched-chain amino acid transport system permease protein